MDGSGSIDGVAGAWDRETALIRSSVTSIGGDASNLAVLTFSSSVRPIVSNITRGEAVAPTSNFTATIQNAIPEKGGTNMGPGIQACQASLAGEWGGVHASRLFKRLPLPA